MSTPKQLPNSADLQKHYLNMTIYWIVLMGCISIVFLLSSENIKWDSDYGIWLARFTTVKKQDTAHVCWCIVKFPSPNFPTTPRTAL